jgi:hypothetical protein
MSDVGDLVIAAVRSSVRRNPEADGTRAPMAFRVASAPTWCIARFSAS